MPSITDVSYDDIKDDNEQVHINLEVLSENDEILFITYYLGTN